MSARVRFILILLAAVNFTHILDFMIMMPLSNFLIPYFEITPQEFSYLVATYSVSAAVSGLIAAFFVDRFDRKKILLFGYGGFLIGTFLCAIAPTYWLLLASRIFAGLFGGLIGAQVLAMAADIVPYEKRGYAMGLIMMSFSISSAFGVPLGLKLANEFSWHAPFYTVVIMGAALFVLLIKYVPGMADHLKHNEGQPRPKVMEVFGNIFSHKTQRLAIFMTATLTGQFLIVPFLTSYMEFNVGFTRDEIPYIYLVGGILTMISSPMAGRIADRIGKFKFFTIMVLTSIIPIGIITNLPPTPFYYVLIVTGIWFVVSTARMVSAQAMITEVVPSKTRGSFMSVNAAIQQISVGIYSMTAGFIIVDTPAHKLLQYNIVGYAAMTVALASFVFGYFLNKHTNLNRTDHEDATTPQPNKAVETVEG